VKLVYIEIESKAYLVRTISPKLGRPVLALLICDTAQTELFKFQPFDTGNVTLLGKYDKSVFLDDLLNWVLSGCVKSVRIDGVVVTAVVRQMQRVWVFAGISTVKRCHTRQLQNEPNNIKNRSELKEIWSKL
jgi:hypothetical protein